MLKIYGYFRSSASYRIRIALNLKGLPYETIPVHLLKDGGEQRKPEYLKKNPMGQIPLLEEGDFLLSQSMAILLYLEKTQPNPAVFSTDIKIQAKQIAICELVNSGIQPINNSKILKYLRDTYAIDEGGIQSWSQHWIRNGFDALEIELAKTAGTYAFGDTVSAADCVIIPQVYNAHRVKVDMGRYPIISRVYTNCEKLEAFKKAHPSNQIDAE